MPVPWSHCSPAETSTRKFPQRGLAEREEDTEGRELCEREEGEESELPRAMIRELCERDAGSEEERLADTDCAEDPGTLKATEKGEEDRTLDPCDDLRLLMPSERLLEDTDVALERLGLLWLPKETLDGLSWECWLCPERTDEVLRELTEEREEEDVEDTEALLRCDWDARDPAGDEACDDASAELLAVEESVEERPPEREDPDMIWLLALPPPSPPPVVPPPESPPVVPPPPPVVPPVVPPVSPPPPICPSSRSPAQRYV